MTIDQFTKSSAPVTVIVNIANPVAIKLIKILLEQGSRLLIIDKINPAKRKLLGDILNRPDCLFMDAESTFKNISKFKKIDYVYYFLSQLSSGSTYPEIFAENMEIEKIDHKEFIRESNRIDAYMKLSLSFEASFTMVTSAYVSQFLELLPEANIQIQKYAESLVLEYVERNNANARIVRLGELIGRDSDMASPTYLARLVREVILRNKVNIFGDGMQQNFLVHAEDAVYAVLKAAFSNEAKGRTLLAAYPHPFTSLSLAYQLLELTVEEKQVLFNEVLPDHEKVSRLKDVCLAPSMGALGWEPQISLEQALAETATTMAQQLNQSWKQVGGLSVAPENQLVENNAGNKVKSGTFSVSENLILTAYKTFVESPILGLLSWTKPSKKRTTPVEKEHIAKRWITVVVSILAIVVSLPYIHFGVTSLRLYVLLKQVKTDLVALDSSKFESYSTQLPVLVDGMASDYKSISYLRYIPTVGDWYTELANAVYGGKSLANSASITLKAVAPAIKIVKGLAAVSPNNPAGTVSRDYYSEIGEIMSYETSISQAIQEAKIGNSRLQRITALKLPNFVQPKLVTALSLSNGYTSSLEEVSKAYDLIPYLLGYKERRNYFIMIQNETEIRATGGWLTNYALLGIENGQVRQLIVNDIYDLDGKIEGVVAPQDMQQALGIKTIKTALSNWNPEMEGTSAQITNMLNQSGVVKPNDVTIAITFQVVRDILDSIGGVEVDGLGQVTSANLYEKVGILHNQFVPGSQEKNKVVSQFMPKFLDAIATASAENKLAVLKVLQNSITQRSLMIYSDSSMLRTKLLDQYNTYRTVTPEANALFAVDWNWGGNKANRFVKRSVDILLNESTKRATMTMLYTNESKTDAYPEGQYVNIQRIYYPKAFAYSQSTGFVKAPKTYISD